MQTKNERKPRDVYDCTMCGWHEENSKRKNYLNLLLRVNCMRKVDFAKKGTINWKKKNDCKLQDVFGIPYCTWDGQIISRKTFFSLSIWNPCARKNRIFLDWMDSTSIIITVNVTASASVSITVFNLICFNPQIF